MNEVKTEVKWINIYEAEESLDELLDECYEPFLFGGVEYMPSTILKEVDPIHYDIALQEHCDYLASEDKIFVRGCTDPEDYEDE